MKPPAAADASLALSAEAELAPAPAPPPAHPPLPPSHAPLATRLLWCADKLGSKRHLAAAAEISEAQLYRYLEQEVAIPHDKLVALAAAAGADSGWLLTGHGPALARTDRVRPPFRPALLLELQEALDLLLVEYQRPFPPALRSRALTYLYDVLRHEEHHTGSPTRLDKFKLLQYVSFLAEMRTEAELDVLREAFDVLEYKGLTPDYQGHYQLLTIWCNLLVRGMRGYYNSYAGQVYFERMGQSLPPEAVAELHALVSKACQVLGKTELDWLDLGCGNGRHLAHMHRHMPNVTLHGLELSDLGVELCRKLEKSERLPEGCVQQGDARLMPYKKNSFDVVFARLSLQGLPYLSSLNLGFSEALEEIHRVIKPSGILAMLLPEGSTFDYMFPKQFFSTATFEKLAHSGWTVLEQHLIEKEIKYSSTMNTPTQNPQKNKKRECFALLRKNPS